LLHCGTGFLYHGGHFLQKIGLGRQTIPRPSDRVVFSEPDRIHEAKINDFFPFYICIYM